MASNLNIDPGLLDRAFSIGGFKTKRQTVNQALKEFIARRKQRETLAFLGTVEFSDDFQAGPERRRQ